MSLSPEEIAQLTLDESWDRFLRSLSPPNRQFAEAAEEKRKELELHMFRMMIEPNERDALQHARWVRVNVEDVIYRWRTVRAQFEWWLRRDCGPPIRVG